MHDKDLYALIILFTYNFQMKKCTKVPDCGKDGCIMLRVFKLQHDKLGNRVVDFQSSGGG